PRAPAARRVRPRAWRLLELLSASVPLFGLDLPSIATGLREVEAESEIERALLVLRLGAERRPVGDIPARLILHADEAFVGALCAAARSGGEQHRGKRGEGDDRVHRCTEVPFASGHCAPP